MSKISLSPNASGTGTFTIASPGTSTDRTLTLPDNSGTLLSNASTAGFPAGSVLQVVQATTSVDTATTSATYSDVTGLTASITPTSASSKVLILVNHNIYTQASDATNGGVRLVRGATAVFTDAIAIRVGTNANVAIFVRSAMNYLDSPNTTSSTTYKVQFARTASAGSSYSVQITQPSNITLMEIAG